FGGGAEVLEGDDFVGEPPSMGFGGRDMAPGQHHPHGDFQRNMLRHPMYTAGPSHQADARLGKSEAGVFGGDDDVAGERDFTSAPEGEAVDGGDNRLGDIEAGGNAGEAALAARKRL